MDLVYRPIAPEEAEDFIRAEAWAFGWQIRGEELPTYPPLREFDRTLAAFEDGRIAGNVRVVSSRMNVPGGSLPTGGIAMVWVQTTYRRRGVANELMSRQLRAIHERGEPLSSLTATGGSIYGHFGYGIGSVHEMWTIERKYTEYARSYPSEGRLRLVDPREMRRSFPEVYMRANTRRPGAIHLSEQFWDGVVMDFTPPGAESSPFFHLAYERDGRIDGYARYRTSGRRVLVDELMSVSVEAYAALWRFCFDLDLMGSTVAVQRPVDDPLPWILADPRRLRRAASDGIWVRLVDVAAALEGRRYMREGRLVIEVQDSFCPWNEGRYELQGALEGARCRPTGARPDLTLSATDLAATYLGTASFATLFFAGRIEEHTSGALSKADSMFAAELKPWGPHGF